MPKPASTGLIRIRFQLYKCSENWQSHSFNSLPAARGYGDPRYRTPVQQVAKTHRDAERCVIASSTHPTGSRPSPAGARPGSTPPLTQGDPPCSSPAWPPGPRQGWAAGSDRFWLLELRVTRTFLDQLRPQLSGRGYPGDAPTVGDWETIGRRGQAGQETLLEPGQQVR